MIKNTIKLILQKLGWQVTKVSKSKGSYIDAQKTIASAKAEGITIGEYVEKLWNQEGQTRLVIDQIQKSGALIKCDNVLEIGAGTGRYLEIILEIVKPKVYEVYEIDQDWTDYLVSEYSPFVIGQPTDGTSLKLTDNESCGLVHAHGVFVYLSLLSCFEYFLEMIRVCRIGGYIIFDFYSESEFSIAAIENWLKYPDRYPVILPYQTVIDYFESKNCQLIIEFDNKYGHGFSKYLIFKKC